MQQNTPNQEHNPTKSILENSPKYLFKLSLTLFSDKNKI